MRAPVLALFLIVGLAGAVFAQSGDAYYELDTLNEGLDAAPDIVDRTTPRGTMESLIFAMQARRWDDAAHLLNLNEVPEDRQAEVGPVLASRLEAVIDRKAVIDWEALLDRPDALDSRAPSRAAMAGEPRRSILLWTLPLENRPAALRLNRVKAGDAAPVWVFSAQTVQNIDALYALYGPSWLERQFPDVLRQEAVWGLMTWELIGLPVLLAAAVALGLAVRLLLDRWARHATRVVTTNVLKAIRGPAIFGAVVALVSWATSALFVFSGRIDTVLSPLITLGITASLLWLVVNAIDAVLDRLVLFGSDELSKREQYEQRAMATKVAAGRRALIVVFVVTAVGVALSSTTLYQNLGLSLIGAAGAITLVLGFAARRVLGNIMSSLQIAMNQSARIGDRVVWDDHLCHVERINFTYVQLRDWVGTRIVVPVEKFASEQFENWTLQEPEMLRVIKVRTAHGADVQRLRETFDEVIDELDQAELGDLDTRAVYVAGQDVFGKDVWFCLPCADPNTSWDMACRARERLLAKAAEIEREDDAEIFPDARAAEAA